MAQPTATRQATGASATLRGEVPLRYAWLALVAVACGGWEEHEDAGLRLLTAQRSSSVSGAIHLKIDALDGETALLVTTHPEAPDRTVFLDAKAPDGTVVYDVDTVWNTGLNATGAAYTLSTSALNWPITATDAPLTPGRWRVSVGAVDTDGNFASSTATDVVVALKSDADFSTGAVSARLVYVGAVGDDAEIVRATEAAVAHWTDLYASVGIDVTVTYDRFATDLPLQAPGEGSGDLYRQISADTATRDVTLMIVDHIDGAPETQGYSGGVPGFLLPSDRTGIAISLVDNGGTDLIFNADEERLYGETLAHEVGHWLGLFHPVELDWNAWDHLPDTPDCTNAASCVADLASNLMFPVAVCDNTSCIPQDTLTNGQTGMMQRSVWVR